MKKSTLNIITLALVLVNVVLTILLTFSLVSTSKKTDALITKIAGLIDLDIEGSSGTGGDTPGIGDIEVVDVLNGDSVKITVTVNDKSGKMHYIVVSGSITLNKKSKDYTSLRPSVDSNMKLITSTVSSTISKYAYENLLPQKDAIASEITKALQDLFKSDMIYNFSFVDYTIQ
ncbi:MAG: hypothetical protein ACI4EV_05260 [Lachnospiraceae bacterium]